MNGKLNKNRPIFHINKTSLDQLYSSKEFELLLQREQARAHRLDSKFSLIVYTVNGLPSKKNHLRSFLQVVRKRIRAVDEIGWFQDHSIGVLLPFADRKGASSFAKDVVTRLSKKVRPFPYSVFSYPSHWYQSGVCNQIGNGAKGKNERARAPVIAQASSAHHRGSTRLR